MTNLFFYLWLIAWVPGYAQDTSAKAYEQYERGLVLYDKALKNGDRRTFLQAESHFLSARVLVAGDTERLTFKTLEIRLIDEGRWPKREQVQVTKRKDYRPNKMIREIRARFPPRPMVFAWVECRSLGCRFVVRLENRGVTSLEDLVLDIRNARGGLVQQARVSLVKANAAREIEISLPSMPSGALRVAFSERYRFAPCSIHVRF